MRSGYLLRTTAKHDRLGAESCPRCAHRMDDHRGMPGECIECDCIISFADLDTWRREGRVSK